MFPYRWHYSWCDYKKKPRYIVLTPKLWWDNARYSLRQVRWFFQRGSRGWADCDCWNMDGYLVKILTPMLRRFKETTHGYPGDLTAAQWDTMLGEMIEGFEAAERVTTDTNLQTGDMTEALKADGADEKIFREKMKLFADRFFDLWD